MKWSRLSLLVAPLVLAGAWLAGNRALADGSPCANWGDVIATIDATVQAPVARTTLVSAPSSQKASAPAKITLEYSSAAARTVPRPPIRR